MKSKFLLLLMIFSLSSCFYFRVIPEQSYDLQRIQNYETSGKVLILHRDDFAWKLYNVKSKDSLLTARLDLQLGYHIKYLEPKEYKLNQFVKGSEPDVIKSVHLYTSDASFNKLDTAISIPVKSIYKVQSYEYAPAPSRASIAAPLIIIPVAVLIALYAYIVSNIEISYSY